MQTHEPTFSVERMAGVLGVSRSGYYHYIHRAPSQRSQENKLLLEKIKMIHQEVVKYMVVLVFMPN